MARDAEVDLVEIAPDAKPPVARIIDFKKFKYEQSKKEQETRRKTQEVHVKEVRMGPFISAHDLEVRIKRSKEFLEEGDRVKLTVRFGGRQMGKIRFGHELLQKIVTALEGKCQVDREARMEGRSLTMTISPIRKGKS